MKTEKFHLCLVTVALLVAFSAVQAQFAVTVTDQTTTAPLANPTPGTYQPRYVSGFGLDGTFTVFFEDRNAGFAISSVSTTSGPTGFPAVLTGTNITDTHFVIKDWPITVASTAYAYRAWGAVGNNPDHHFYVSNDLINWTLVSTFTIPNAASFTDAHGWVYYGFHDVILLNGTYYAFAESNQSQTMLVRSTNGDDVWEAFAGIGGLPGWGPLELPTGVSNGWTPTGSFVDLGYDRGYGKIHADPRDNYFYLAINTAAQASLSPAALEAAFINPANWTWHDGTTGPASNPILSATAEHDLRECWVVPNSDPNADWVIIYDADFGSADGGKALGYATLTPPPPPRVHNLTQGTHYQTITAAVTAANPGDVIQTDPGTYNEAVNVDKSLTLKGESGAIIKPDNTTPLLDSGVRRAAVYIAEVDNVTIDGFEIDGTGGDVHIGIYGLNSDNSTVKNNLIHDLKNEIAAPVSDVAGVGILFFGWGQGIDNVVIESNTVYNTGRMGIFVGGMQSSSPYAFMLSSNNSIEHNLVHHAWQGPTNDYGGAVQINGANSSLVHGNVIHDTGLNWYGIYIAGSASGLTTIVENEVYNNKYGVVIWSNVTFVDYGASFPGAPEAHLNSIHDNMSYGLWAVDTAPSLMVNAEKNWWGSATGPAHASNPSGTGNAVTNGVDFDPWLCDGTDTDPEIGFQPDVTFLCCMTPPVVDAGADRSICIGETIVLGGNPTASGNGPFTYSWDPTTGLDDPTAANPNARPTSATTYTVIVTDATGCGATASVAINVHEYVFLSDGFVKVNKNRASDGNIHSNSKIEFGAGYPGTHTGNLTALDDITIKTKNTIVGDATAGDELYLFGTADVTGTENEHAIVTAIPMPSITFSVGGPNKSVAKNGSLNLATGSYGKVKVNSNATLFLSSGDYFIDILDTESSAKLSCDVTNGPVNIHVMSDLDLATRVQVLITGTGAATDQVSFITLQDPKVDIGKQAIIRGALIAQNAEVHFSQGCKFRGSVCANGITLDADVKFQFHTSGAPFPKPSELENLEDEDAIEAADVVVTEYQLQQNYPNPFNPSTKIAFSVKDAGRVELAIYNLQGQLVRKLISREMNVGHHEIMWNGRDETGSSVPSGVYLYKLRVNGFEETRKMMLMK